jgi:hypothetical protein
VFKFLEICGSSLGPEGGVSSLERYFSDDEDMAHHHRGKQYVVRLGGEHKFFWQEKQMKRKHGSFLGFAVLLIAAMFTAAGCDTGGGGGGNGGNGGNGGGNTVNITFGDISDASTQEQVTRTIRSSVELLQAQTQNIINKLEEYEEALRQELNAAWDLGDMQQNDAILTRIRVVTSIIEYEGQIKSAQQSRYTDSEINNMDSAYDSIIGRFFIDPISGLPLIDGQLLTAKMSTYREIVRLDERNIIGPAEQTMEIKSINSARWDIIDLEGRNGNHDYSLPSPTDNMSGLRSKLQSECKQVLSSQETLGDYGQYIFYQGEDLAEYRALLLDAKELGHSVNLP